MEYTEDLRGMLTRVKYNLINDESSFEHEMDNLSTTLGTEYGKVQLGIKLLDEDSTMPEFQHEGDSGFDLRSMVELEVSPGQIVLIRTGVSFDIPKNMEIQVRSRSGMASKGLIVMNSPGTVDSSYTGEVKVLLFNATPQPFTVEKGMRIAQAVLCPVYGQHAVNLVEVKSTNYTERGDKGFGSTGSI